MGKKICAILNCKNTSDNVNVSFYDARKRLAPYRSYWLKFCDGDKVDQRVDFVCSDHFDSVDFINASCKYRGVRKHAIPTRNVPGTQIELNDSDVEIGANEEIGYGTSKEEPHNIPLNESLIEPKKVIRNPAALRDHDYFFTHERFEEINEKMQKVMKDNTVLRKKLRAAVRKQKSAMKWKDKLRKTRVKTIRKKVPLDGGGFLNELTRNSVRPLKGARYSEETKKIALGLYYCSTRAYTEMAKHFRLPSISLIKKWMRNIQISEGFSKNIMELLKEKAKLLSLKDRVVSISIDEMTLKPNLSYLGKAKPDIILGFPTKLPGKALDVSTRAASVLVVMLKVLSSGYKQSVGYFFSPSGFKADDLLAIFQDSVREIADTGFIPKVLVCDQNATNRSLFTKLGISQEHPFCEVHGQKIFGFFDPPHLLKSSRNNLMHHNGVYDGGIIKWDHIRQLFDEDSTRLPRAAPKLSIHHIFLPAFGEMRVGVAAETLSATVSAAIDMYVTLNVLPQECNFTSKYCADLDSLFDIFNGSSNATKGNKALRQPLTNGSIHWEVLKQLEEKLKSLRFVDKQCDSVETEHNYKKLPKQSRLPWFIDGWLLNINSLRLLWADLNESFGFDTLETRNINQDCLENFFGIIRMKNINNNRPDPCQFRSAYRAAVVNQLLKCPVKSNCEQDPAVNVLSLVDYSRLKLFNPTEEETGTTDFLSGQNPRENDPIEVEIGTADLLSDQNPQENDIDTDAEATDMSHINCITYTAGWIIHAITHETCRQKIKADDPSPHEHYILTNNKNASTDDVGSYQLEQLLSKITNHFKQFFTKYLEVSNVGLKQRMNNFILKTYNTDILCRDCRKAVCDKYLNMLLKGQLKDMNQKMTKKRGSGKSRKTTQSEKAKKLNI